MASVAVYCLCGKPYDPTKFMIQCDACKDWFHGSCVGLYEHLSSDIEKYHCPKCEKMFGPSISKPRTNWHRHNFSEKDADQKAVQTGTPVFIKELKSRHFPSAEEVVRAMRGQQLTLPFLIQNGFDFPILVENMDGLGLIVPPLTFSVEDVEAYLGPGLEIDAIDVSRQEDLRMTLHEFVRYYNSPNRDKVFNVISLEFSESRMSSLVEPPYIVNKLSWIENFWPEKLPDDCPFARPNVHKYCLVGVRDSYTDFHIDFGGTSVWYHVLKGEKVFYLIRPTQANLALYKRWMASTNRSETFFGDQVDACHRCIVRQGHTLLIPTGWIHAVFTPVDSLVFGGNFLHSLNVPLQLQVYEIERRIKTPEKYRFPWFEACSWFAARHLLDELRDHSSKEGKPLPHIVQAGKALVSALKHWTQDKEQLKVHKDEIPATIQYAKLIKDMAKEVRHAEKIPPSKKGKLRQLPPRNKRGQSSKLGILHTTEQSSFVHDTPHKLTVLPPSGGPPDDGVGPPFPATLPKAEIKSELPPLHQHPPVNTFQNSPAVTVKRDVSEKRVDDSIYDFCESDDDSLVVDENPSRLSGLGANHYRKADRYGRKQQPIRLKLSIGSKLPPIIPQQQTAVETNNGQIFSETQASPSSPKLAGIEELLRASGYATEDSSKLTPVSTKAVSEVLNDSIRQFDNRVPQITPESVPPVVDCDDSYVASQSGRTSPSTREAIQGMLSIGQDIHFSSSLITPASAFSQQYTTLLPPTVNAPSVGVARNCNSIVDSVNSFHMMTQAFPTYASQPTMDMYSEGDQVFIPREACMSAVISEEEEMLAGCHQDDEFVYPSLEASDDDGPVFKSRGREKHDEPWNPKARLVPNCPKPVRPVREGTRKEAVESSLAAAKAKLAHLPPPKRAYHRRKPLKSKKLLPKEVESIPGPSAADTNLFDPMTPLNSKSGGPFKGKKPRRGFATTKQRLGRILKIHKMLY